MSSLQSFANLSFTLHYGRWRSWSRRPSSPRTGTSKVIFVTKAMDGYAFFSVEHMQGGLTAIVFNTNHPAYNDLIETLEPKIEDETDAELLERVHRAADTLELIFAAWARYEMEEVQQKDRLFEMRQEWGKMARFFLTDPDD